MSQTKKATFGAGCFWGVEDEFGKTQGVKSTRVGYSGGESENPNYEQVCSGSTGHAEVVEVEYDPEEVSYEDLVKKFFAIHDPTTLNRQGPDVGTQYRSIVLAHDEDQKTSAAKVKADLQQRGVEAVTEIEDAKEFYEAEEYHQKYLEKKR